MFEFIGLLGLVFVCGTIALAIGIVLLPFYLLFKLLGFALKVGFAGLVVGFFGLLLLPVALIVGVVLLFKLLVLAIPVLLILALASFLIGFFRKDEPQTVYVQQ